MTTHENVVEEIKSLERRDSRIRRSFVDRLIALQKDLPALIQAIESLPAGALDTKAWERNNLENIKNSLRDLETNTFALRVLRDIQVGCDDS